MNLRRWTHRQLVLVVWLAAAAIAGRLGGLVWAVPVIVAAAGFYTWLFVWLATRRRGPR